MMLDRRYIITMIGRERRRHYAVTLIRNGKTLVMPNQYSVLSECNAVNIALQDISKGAGADVRMDATGTITVTLGDGMTMTATAERKN